MVNFSISVCSKRPFVIFAGQKEKLLSGGFVEFSSVKSIFIGKISLDQTFFYPQAEKIAKKETKKKICFLLTQHLLYFAVLELSSGQALCTLRISKAFTEKN